MPSAFITALQLSILTVKNNEGYTCACGLHLGLSVDNISVAKDAAVLQAAHYQHHNKHFGKPATLYMQGESTPPGNNAIVAAWCSCDEVTHG